MKTNKIEIVEHGVMLSDYFHGTSGVMLSIQIDNKTTKKELIENIEDEIHMIYDHIQYTAEYKNYTGDIENDVKNEIEKMKEYIKGNEDKISYPDLEWCFADMSDEECEEEQAVFIMAIEFTEE